MQSGQVQKQDLRPVAACAEGCAWPGNPHGADVVGSGQRPKNRMQLLPSRCSKRTSEGTTALRCPQAHSGQETGVLVCCSMMHNAACHHINMADHRVAQSTRGSTAERLLQGHSLRRRLLHWCCFGRKSEEIRHCHHPSAPTRHLQKADMMLCQTQQATWTGILPCACCQDTGSFLLVQGRPLHRGTAPCSSSGRLKQVHRVGIACMLLQSGPGKPPMRSLLCNADFSNTASRQAGHLLLRPVAGQASNEQLVGAVCNHGANHVQPLQRHCGVGLCGAQQHGHVVVVVVGPPHLQEGAA